MNRLIDLVLQENDRAEAAGEHIPFAEPIETDVNRGGDLETIEIPLNADTGDKEALDAVELLREELVPEAFPGDSIRALVTGFTGAELDRKDVQIARTPYVVIFVVLTAFVVLVALYRSLLVADHGVPESACCWRRLRSVDAGLSGRLGTGRSAQL